MFGVLMVENQHVKDDAGCEVPLHGGPQSPAGDIYHVHVLPATSWTEGQTRAPGSPALAPRPMSPLTLPHSTRTALSLHFFPSDSDFYYDSKMEVGGGPGKEGEPPGRAPEHSCPLTRSPSVHRWVPVSIPSPPRPIAREPSKPTGKSVPCAREPCGWATTPTPKAFSTR